MTVILPLDPYFTGRNCNPLISGTIKPRQTQIISAIQVGVLAMRKPPTTLIIASTVSIGNVPVIVNSRELHVILIFKSVAGVAAERAHSQFESLAVIRHQKLIVIGLPILAVDVFHINLQLGTVVFG